MPRDYPLLVCKDLLSWNATAHTLRGEYTDYIYHDGKDIFIKGQRGKDIEAFVNVLWVFHNENFLTFNSSDKISEFAILYFSKPCSLTDGEFDIWGQFNLCNMIYLGTQASMMPRPSQYPDLIYPELLLNVYDTLEDRGVFFVDGDMQALRAPHILDCADLKSHMNWFFFFISKKELVLSALEYWRGSYPYNLLNDYIDGFLVNSATILGYEIEDLGLTSTDSIEDLVELYNSKAYEALTSSDPLDIYYSMPRFTWEILSKHEVYRVFRVKFLHNDWGMVRYLSSFILFNEFQDFSKPDDYNRYFKFHPERSKRELGNYEREYTEIMISMAVLVPD